MNVITITVNTPTSPAEVIRWLDPFHRRDDGTGGQTGVPAMVPAGPSHGGGGMYLDEP